MRNFDYLQELGLTDLHRFCSSAEELQVSNPEFSAISARKALEYIVKALYLMKNVEIPERVSLFELVDGEVFRELRRASDDGCPLRAQGGQQRCP